MSVTIVVGDNEHEWNRKRPEPDFAVYVQDFDDDYHRESHEPSSDLERQVRRIQRRYRKLDKYLVAVAAYNEYMVYIVEKNGGPDLYKLKAKEGLIQDFIPPKPRLRQNAMNNFLMKHKIVLSNVDIKKIKPEKLEDAVSKYLYDPDEISEVSDGLMVLPDEENVLSKKLTKRAEREMEGSDGRELSRISSIARLEAFHLNKRQVVQEDVYEKMHEISMTALLNGEYEDPSDYNPLESVNYRGRYVTAEMRDQLEFYATLNDAGWNALKIQRKQTGAKVSSTSNRVNRLLRDESKSLKRNSKKSKKKKKKVGNFLSALSEKSGYASFEDYQKEVFSMTTNNSSDY